MEIFAIRLNNLKQLVKEYGSLDAIAKRTGQNPNWLSQIHSGHGNMGTKTARVIEDGLGLKQGWLDVPRALFPGDVYENYLKLQPTQQKIVHDLINSLAGDTG